MKFKFTPRLKVVSAFFMLCLWIPSAFAASNAELESRIAELEKKLEEKPVSVLGGLGDKITLSGAIELDYSYNTDSDVTDNTASSSESDLGIGTIELGLEAALHEYVTANVLLKGEDLDDDDKVFFDEVFFTLAKDGMPVYFVGGKRYQPFGTFESLFINDPITQDLYEINKTGATLGYADEALMGLDVSFTLYKGTSLVEKINDNKDDYGIEYPGTDTSNVSSYIINAGIAPMEGLNIAAFYNSEPGDRDRNTTLGGSIHYEIAGFMADFEYITALERDTVAGGQESNETAWTASLGYQVMDPLVIAVRYESFDADKTVTDFVLDNRYSLGATYTLFDNDSVACNLMGEYRHTEYEVAAASTHDEDNNEFFARLALEF